MNFFVALLFVIATAHASGVSFRGKREGNDFLSDFSDSAAKFGKAAESAIGAASKSLDSVLKGGCDLEKCMVEITESWIVYAKVVKTIIEAREKETQQTWDKAVMNLSKLYEILSEIFGNDRENMLNDRSQEATGNDNFNTNNRNQFVVEDSPIYKRGEIKK